MLKFRAPKKIEKEILPLFGAFFKWIFLSVLVGAIGGGAGTAFYFGIVGATRLRTETGWLIYVLPVCGLLIAFLYRATKISEPQGTNLVLEAIRSPDPIPLKMAPLIFISTILTHLGGGSAGREGAALQLGGSLGYHTGRLFRLDEKDLHIITMCGMASCFSALFGTPLTSTIFVMEVITVGVMYYSALVPCTIASIVGAEIAAYFHTRPTAFPIHTVPKLDVVSLLRVAVLAILCAMVSILFCFAMRQAGRLYKKYIRNSLLRAAAGGVIMILMFFIFGEDYLGAGGNIIAAAMSGTAKPEAFAVKLLLTAITLGAGFKGGEIVPAFFVGATFGCVAGGLLGLNATFAASIGFMAVFCGVTNCPLTSFILSMEVFGSDGVLFYLLAAGISYMLSGYTGIYSKQKILYAKNKPQYLG